MVSRPAAEFDAIVVGGGHNGLVAAAYLARAGWGVCLLERNDEVGGCVATEELTLPGYRHDVMSAWHPLFHLSQAFAELGPELADHGLEYLNTDEWTSASVGADGSTVLAHRDPAKSVTEFTDRDGAAYLAEIERFGSQIDLVGGLMGDELHSARALRRMLRLGRRLGKRERYRFGADMVSSARGWFDRTFKDPQPAHLLAPWVLHTGLDPDAAGGGFLTLAIAATPHAVGMPVVKGGSVGFAHAFRGLIEAHGGVIRTAAEVDEIVVRGGRAAGVRVGGEEIGAARAVIANVTPTQLHGRLLAAVPAAAEEAREAALYRYNRRSGMQVHLALSGPLRWRDPRLDSVPIVHCADDTDQVSLACSQAAVGLLPRRPTVVVGQPTVLDPSRAPDGGAILWLQLQEVPRHPVGDAAGELEVGRGWTEELVSAYVERVLDRLRPHVEDLDGLRLQTVALPPAELERRNPNLVGGDIYAGDAGLDQSYLWRPLPGNGSHATAVKGLFQCGAGTYPGAGLNAASGRIAAKAAMGLRRNPLSRI